MALPTLDATFASSVDLPRRQMLARWLVEELGETQAASNVSVSGAGSSGVNGPYIDAGFFGGKRFYNLQSGGCVIAWDSPNWVIRNIASITLYTSNNNVEFPWQVTTWSAASGSAPVPTVSESPSPSPISNYYDLPERYLWAKIAVAAGGPKTEAAYISLPKNYAWSDIYNAVAGSSGNHTDWTEKQALGHIAAAYRGDTGTPENLATYIDWPWRYQVAAIIDGFVVVLTATFVYEGATLVDSVFGTIPAGWQDSNTDIDQLVLGTSATTIGSQAFYLCTSLTGTLTIPNSVTSIGGYAFRTTAFTGSLTLGSSVTSIGSGAFSYCSGLTGPLTIPNSVTSIGDYAFRESGWGTATYPLTISGTVGLTSNSFYGTDFNGLNVTGTSVNANQFQSASYVSGSLTIANTVTSIGSYAFSYSANFTSLTLGNSITSIGSAAFRYCSGLTGSLNVPNSVTSIGAYAFGSLTVLTGPLIIPNSATAISNNIIEGCPALTDAYLNQPLAAIDSDAFIGSGLTTIHLRPSPNTPAGWTIGSGQTIGNKSGVTVVADWTTYPNPP